MISLITPLILLTLSIVILYVSGEIIIKSSTTFSKVNTNSKLSLSKGFSNMDFGREAFLIINNKDIAYST